MPKLACERTSTTVDKRHKILHFYANFHVVGLITNKNKNQFQNLTQEHGDD